MGRGWETVAWAQDLQAAVLAGHLARVAGRARTADGSLATRDPDQRYLTLLAHLGHSNCLRSPAARACVLAAMRALRGCP